MKYINLTPRWTEILPIWRRVAINNVNDSNFWGEMERIAQGADNFNDLIAYLRNMEDWTDDAIQTGIEAGQRYQERERTTVKESA